MKQDSSELCAEFRFSKQTSARCKLNNSWKIYELFNFLFSEKINLIRVFVSILHQHKESWLLFLENIITDCQSILFSFKIIKTDLCNWISYLIIKYLSIKFYEDLKVNEQRDTRCYSSSRFSALFYACFYYKDKHALLLDIQFKNDPS